MQLLHGDCLEVMRDLEANSVDTIITDPPYGLTFMGKNWDHGVPGVPFWLEALRVAKPGAFLLAFGGSRTYHRLTCAIEDAGWEIRDCIMWIYASGFPKSLDIGKAIDAKAGAEREVIGKSARHVSGKPEQRTAGLVGSRTFAETIGMGAFLTAPATDLARQWDGWGSSLKPAHEPIVVAMKPLESTFAANAEKYGVAGLWIDGGRIGTAEADDYGRSNARADGTTNKGDFFPLKSGVLPYASPLGRWPANVIFDEASGALLDAQSGERPGMKRGVLRRGATTGRSIGGYGVYGDAVPQDAEAGYSDTGGASRFFLSIPTPRYCLLCEQELRQKEEGSCESANTVAPITSPSTPDSDSVRAVAQAQPRPSSEASNPSKRTPALSVVSSGRTTPATGESTAPESAPALPVKQLARHVKSAAHLCDTCTTLTVLALVAIKTSDSSRAASLLGAGSITEHTRQILIPNLVAFAEMWGDIDTIPTIASLKMLFGSVRDAMQHSTPTDATGTEYARIKYTPKASRAERNAGLEGMPERMVHRMGHGNNESDPKTQAFITHMQNHHPTVKPLALMEYLCKLTRTPTGGVVLDPFMGSGSTGVACVMTDRDFIGIEQDAEYLEIARARIEAEQAKPKQLGLAI